MNRILLLFIFLVLFVSPAVAGIDSFQSDTQTDIVNKVALPADGMAITIQAGPNDSPATVKLRILDSSGAIVAAIYADGSIRLRNSLYVTGSPTGSGAPLNISTGNSAGDAGNINISTGNGLAGGDIVLTPGTGSIDDGSVILNKAVKVNHSLTIY